VCVGGGGFQRHGRDRNRFATTAGRCLVRVVEDEAGRHFAGLEIHLGAEQKQNGLRIDQDGDALVLDHLVGGADLVFTPTRKPAIGLSDLAMMSRTRAAAASVSETTLKRGNAMSSPLDGSPVRKCFSTNIATAALYSK
jgi:hypothetical protein